ncbi:hypothetical protein PTKIN_Ptkin10aG0154400 [Pterospermum kingtungense]
MVEAITAVQALRFASEMGFRNIELEGDSLRVINRLAFTDEDWSPTGNIIEEGRFLCKFFCSCKISHTLRAGNQVAHELAKFGVGCDEDHVWIEDNPGFIQGPLSTDCSHFV